MMWPYYDQVSGVVTTVVFHINLVASQSMEKMCSNKMVYLSLCKLSFRMKMRLYLMSSQKLAGHL